MNCVLERTTDLTWKLKLTAFYLFVFGICPLNLNTVISLFQWLFWISSNWSTIHFSGKTIKCFICQISSFQSQMSRGRGGPGAISTCHLLMLPCQFYVGVELGLGGEWWKKEKKRNGGSLSTQVQIWKTSMANLKCQIIREKEDAYLDWSQISDS